MDLEISTYYEDLNLLCDCLGNGNDDEWTHQLRKQLLQLLHKLKFTSRKLANQEIEMELLDIESSFGFGSGSSVKPNMPAIEEHQLKVLELIDKYQNFEDNENVEAEVVEDENVEAEVVEDEIKEDVVDEIKLELVLCNCQGRDAARELARGLVEKRLAARVNIIANIGSVYWCNGEVKDTAECQLQIKTSANNFENCLHYIKQNHPSEVPEILSVPITKGNEDYFEWVKQETSEDEYD